MISTFEDNNKSYINVQLIIHMMHTKADCDCTVNEYDKEVTEISQNTINKYLCFELSTMCAIDKAGTVVIFQNTAYFVFWV